MTRSLRLFGLLALLFITLSLAAQSERYTVQVGTFLDARSADFETVRSLGFIYANPLERNMSQVYLGHYPTAAAAEKAAAGLKQRGFANATVLRIPVDQGVDVAIIQMATRALNRSIDWESLDRAGQLFVITDGETVKVATGVYPNADAAAAALPAIKKLGYGDAFVKVVNNQTLIPITTFESGIKKELIPITIQDPPARPAPGPAAPSAPTTYDRGGPVTPPAAAVTRPAAPAGTTARALPSVREKLPLPSIRAKVKRTSALDLQRVLKSSGYYAGSLDGYYGPGTRSAYESARTRDSRLRQYYILAENMPANSGPAGDAVQRAVDNLLTDPAARQTLDRSSGPVPHAYRAYQSFVTMGSNQEVNKLMNQAIREAYPKGRTAGLPFDPQSTYAYESLQQLILHLHYIHAAPGVNYRLPCWLYDAHPNEATAVQAALENFPTAEIAYSGCDPFLAWPEIGALRAAAYDLSANNAADDMNTEAAARRAQLYLTREPLSTSSARAAEAWNLRIWENLSAWAAKDPLHTDMVRGLKISYYQSQVRLEDYFMDQGFPTGQAQELALATLQALVAMPLDRFQG